MFINKQFHINKMSNIIKKELMENLIKAQSLINEIKEKNIKEQKKDSFLFQKRKENYLIISLENLLKKISNDSWKFALKINNKEIVLLILNLSINIEKFSLENIKIIEKNIFNLSEIISKLELNNENKINDALIPSNIKVPNAISEEINSDLNEMKKCFSYGLYKSTVILCGRILEVSLHRKYFELTNHDILETQPGIGLGKLVAKLSEKKISFDPGINEQIHLINKIRVQSVHKKHEHFMPSKEQAYATILYTLDIVKKLFK
jgi:hypothetical protein